MDWWKIRDEKGQVGEHAVRGLDSIYNNYNGNRPTEIITGLVDNILRHAIFKDESIEINRAEPLMKVKYDEMYDLLLNKQIKGLFQNGDAIYLQELIDIAWLRVNDEYFQTWSRGCYPSERRAIVNFVIRGRFDER